MLSELFHRPLSSPTMGARDEDEITPLPDELILDSDPPREPSQTDMKGPASSIHASFAVAFSAFSSTAPRLDTLDEEEREYQEKLLSAMLETYQPPSADALPGQIYEEVTRSRWVSRFNCILSMLGFSIGVANIYRFPYLVFKYGGAVFIITYTVMMILVGFPLLYLEVIVGQYTSSGVIRTWYRLVPLFRGVGWTSAMLPFMLTFHYNTFLAWALFYVYNALTNVLDSLPWVGCDHPWNTLSCRDIPFDFEEVDVKVTELRAGAEFFRGGVQKKWKSRAVGKDNFSASTLTFGNESFGLSIADTLGAFALPTESTLSLGPILLLIYIAIYYFTYTGFRYKSQALLWTMVVYPYVLAAIVVFRALAVPGADFGLQEMFGFPDHGKSFGNWKMYVAALEFVFYSVGVAGGVHITMSSYNVFTNDCLKDARLLIIVDYLSCILGGMMCFIALGSVAESDGSKDFNELFQHGPDLVFEVFCDFWGRIPQGDVYTTLFFGLIVGMGLETSIETCISFKNTLFEAFGPWFERNGETEWVFFNTLYTASFGISILCILRGGYDIYILLDVYSASIGFFTCAFFTLVGFVWIWGLDEVCNATECMTGRRPGLYLRMCWKYITPTVLPLLLVMKLSIEQEIEFKVFGNQTFFQPQYVTLGRIIAHFPNLFILLGVISYLFYNTQGLAWKTRFKLSISPNYEHEEILQTGRCKRLTLSHYSFSLYPKKKIETVDSEMPLSNGQQQQQAEKEGVEGQPEEGNAAEAEGKTDPSTAPSKTADEASKSAKPETTKADPEEPVVSKK